MLLNLRVYADTVVVHLADRVFDSLAAEQIGNVPVWSRRFDFHAEAMQPFPTVELERHLGDGIVAGALIETNAYV